MQEKKIQILKSYPEREEIKEFISPYRLMPLKKIDNEENYQVYYMLPPVWLIALFLLLPIVFLCILPVPLFAKISFTVLDLIMIPVFIYIFKRLFRDKIEPIKVRFLYDKAAALLQVPDYEIQIPRADIKEFSVLYGWMKTPSNNTLIAELSVVYKDNDAIKRIPLLLSGKSECMKIAGKLSEYTGKENYFIKV